MVALILIGAVLELVGVICGYMFGDPSAGNSLMTGPFNARRRRIGARVGLAAAVSGFVLLIVAAIASVDDASGLTIVSAAEGRSDRDFTLTVGILTAVASLFVAVIAATATGRQQRHRLRTELRTEFMAEEAIGHLLRHAKWRRRTFETIRRRIGGFDDDELRQLLVRAGAIRGEGDGGTELWGLRERNHDWLD